MHIHLFLTLLLLNYMIFEQQNTKQNSPSKYEDKCEFLWAFIMLEDQF